VSAVLVALALVPLVAVGAAFFTPARATAWVGAVCGTGTFVLVLALVPSVARGATVRAGFLRVDAVSLVFLLATGFVYATTALYAVGYLRGEEHRGDFSRYARLFHVGLNLFAWSMLLAPMADGLALLWVAIEVTTVVSALLVAVDDTDDATEAAWKYIVLASVGLGVALLATVFMYYAGSQRLGTSYDLAFGPLLAEAAHLPHTPVLMSFCLAVLGFGTKVGLVPMHTWLPDAHAEAPTPVSALLSGSLLAVSLYAVLRYYQVAVATLGPTVPQRVLLVFGVLSLLLAALYLLEQHNIKRMLAYSSIEHMGILAIGVSFGAPIALAGVLLHVLAHAAAKGNAFMGAGVLVQRFGTKRMDRIRGGMDTLPLSAPLFLGAVLVLSALPPFGIFRSEFQIVQGGLGSGGNAAAAALVVLVTLAFLGLATSSTRMVVARAAERRPRAEAPATMVVPVVVGLVALLVLGVHPPGPLADLLARGAAQLGVGP
jgi:hydrogenase-4 component F